MSLKAPILAACSQSKVSITAPLEINFYLRVHFESKSAARTFSLSVNFCSVWLNEDFAEGRAKTGVWFTTVPARRLL